MVWCLDWNWFCLSSVAVFVPVEGGWGTSWWRFLANSRMLLDGWQMVDRWTHWRWMMLNESVCQQCNNCCLMVDQWLLDAQCHSPTWEHDTVVLPFPFAPLLCPPYPYTVHITVHPRSVKTLSVNCCQMHYSFWQENYPTDHSGEHWTISWLITLGCWSLMDSDFICVIGEHPMNRKKISIWEVHEDDPIICEGIPEHPWSWANHWSTIGEHPQRL